MSLLSPQLEAFLAVVKHKTVHGGAADVCITQTAVTQRIRGLEKQLKVTLFIRSRRGMSLTSEGEALLRYCQAAKDLEGQALASIQGSGILSEVAITLCAPTSMMRARIMPCCIPVMKAFPKLLVHFNVDDIERRLRRLRSGEVDMAVCQTELPSGEMRTKPLAPEEYVLVASAKWKGRKLKDIIKNERIIDFDPEDQVSFNYLKRYDLFEGAQTGRYFVNRTEDLVYLVQQGVGYTALPKEFALPYVKNGQLKILNAGKTLNINSVLAWYDRPEPPAYFRAIIDAIH